ncbi:hypothetical protein B0J12DRAFT_582525, partial [Macrophomina phaseolina]
PIRIKFIPSLAFSVTRQRSTTDKPIKPPGKNWPRAFEKRYPELKARGVRAIDWKRHGNNLRDKITEWFEGLERYYRIWPLRQNIILCSVKVLVSKDDLRDYGGAGVKRIVVTAIECVSADGRSLLPLTI